MDEQTECTTREIDLQGLRPGRLLEVAEMGISLLNPAELDPEELTNFARLGQKIVDAAQLLGMDESEVERRWAEGRDRRTRENIERQVAIVADVAAPHIGRFWRDQAATYALPAAAEIVRRTTPGDCRPKAIARVAREMADALAVELGRMPAPSGGAE